jgi:hypothetical protein
MMRCAISFDVRCFSCAGSVGWVGAGLRPYNRPGDENDAEARDRQTGPIQAAQGCHI